MSEFNINILQQGMSFSNHSTLKEGQFSLLLNGNIQSVDGSFLMVTNDHSNILVSRLKEGFKVIGTNIVPSLNLTFLFLVNPSTRESEIGFIYDVTSPDKPDLFDDCNNIIEQTPLEEQTQICELGNYNTFVNANCLNFDINFPISSWVKIDDCNVRIYFNDFKNNPRYIDYKNFPKETISNCPLIETSDLDCDKIKIFPESCYPQVKVVDVVSGGENKAGVYQFAVAYSDVNSNKMTDYYFVTNPIPLFDQPITVNTDYPVYKSFKLQITNLNTDFKYFNLVVIKTINTVTSVNLIETFEINSSNFSYVYTGIERNIQQNLVIDDIITKSPFYNKAKLTTESNGYLMMTNLEEPRILNLQPTINEITPLWQTVELNEGDYANPIIAQNFVGYLGDEVYPLGISFTRKTGKNTNVFPFVGRVKTDIDDEDVSEILGSLNPDVIGNSVCSTTAPPTGRWEVYNTARVSGSPICVEDTTGATNLVEIVDEIDCFSEDILINSISSVDSNGNPVYNPVPNFYYYPSFNPLDVHYIGTNPNTGLPYNFPTQTLDDILGIIAYTQQPGNQINENDYYQNTMCDCNDYLSQYPAGATAIATPLNPVVNPQVDNSNIEVSLDERIISVNTYSAISDPQDKIPNPTGIPASSPDPCKNYVEGSDDDEKGFTGWINAKENNTFSGATTVVQSSSDQCNIDTWGSFIGNSGGMTESWYQFYVTNQDGVASILLSTDIGNCSGNGSNNASFELYAIDSLGNPIGSAISPTQYSVGSNGIYGLFTGLQQGEGYFIKVLGQYPNPTGLVRECCKYRSFRLCVTSPKPVNTVTKIVPGIARMVKTCEITYMGIPENSCEPKPYQFGTFSYWESQETYPCNEKVWGNLAGKPIRHFKFPDNSISPFFRQKGSLVDKISTKLNRIYPKGFVVNINEIKQALDKAVSLGLITEQEKLEICGYRIHRGNRRGNQSIIAKGLVYDVWDYKDNLYNTGNNVLFPNFPYNDNRPNEFIKNKPVKNITKALDSDFLRHPFNGVRNNKYTFHSPNTHFNNPGLGVEIKLECEQFGVSVGKYNELKNNAKYQYIGAGIISAAIGFASVEAAFESLNTMVNATLTLDLTIFGSGTSIPLGLILALVGENIVSPMRMYSHYGEWYELIKGFAPYINYGLTYASEGKYLNYKDVPQGNIRRTIANAQYIKPGIINVKTERGSIRFNNFKRESSVFIELQERNVDQALKPEFNFFQSTQTEDTSRFIPDCNYNSKTTSISSYYASLKNQNTSQYGQIDNIEWIDTGYNGVIDWSNSNQDTSCDTIFGGDTYINRFALKKKFPMFLEDRVLPNTATSVNPLNLDIQMSLLQNVGFPRFFMNYPTSIDYTGATQALFGDVAVNSKIRSDYNFLCAGATGKAWADTGLASAIISGFAAVSFGVISLPIAVGVISGAVKKDLGNDVYLLGKYIHSFYGIPSFLCESDYNIDYRHGENFLEKNFYPNVADINEWTQESVVNMNFDNFYSYNRDYSKQNNENPNFILNNNFKQEIEDCKVVHPNRLIYSLQDNDQNSNFDGNLIFPANNQYNFPKSGGKVQIVKGLQNGKVLVIQENQASVFNSFISLETNIETSAVGSNSMFNKSIPAQFIQTDLGFAGTQTQAIITTEFGTYWVDNKRGQIINYSEGVNNIIKPEEDWWFKENLPFHILEDFPEYDVTNNFKDIGMIITYDSRYKRIIFTKRDYELKPEYKGHVTYDGQLFHFCKDVFNVDCSKYFCNKSWTISYSPLLKSFISFHSFTPNYYIPNQNYFYSGINFPINNQDEIGLWGHNLTNQSYQVYYQTLYPFIQEYSVGTKYKNKQLESITYTAEFYRFQDNISSALIPDKTFNQALIYNQKQTSGMLELIPKQKNNRQQSYLYATGKQNTNSRSILVEFVERQHTFNQYYDVAIENSGQPLLSYQCDNVAYKTLNSNSISYTPQYVKKKLMSDYHVIRLINSKYSNYKIISRYNITKTNNINN